MECFSTRSSSGLNSKMENLWLLGLWLLLLLVFFFRLFLFVIVDDRTFCAASTVPLPTFHAKDFASLLSQFKWNLQFYIWKSCKRFQFCNSILIKYSCIQWNETHFYFSYFLSPRSRMVLQNSLNDSKFYLSWRWRGLHVSQWLEWSFGRQIRGNIWWWVLLWITQRC